MTSTEAITAERQRIAMDVISLACEQLGLPQVNDALRTGRSGVVSLRVAIKAVEIAFDAQVEIVRPPAGISAPPPSNNRVWCEQCDAMVQRDKASHCRSKFCSVRP